jgi:signal transduction histidine kinase
MGADDYVIKPFSPRELAARVKALLRRATAPTETDQAPLRRGALRLDVQRYRCFWGEVEIVLTVTKFALLRSLMGLAEKVYSRGELVDRAYGLGHAITDRTVDTHIRRIRRKLAAAGGDPIEAQPIEPQLPLGYVLEPPAPAALRVALVREGATWRAGAVVEPFMRRAARSNLSGARLLDLDGCVVATTGDDIGVCLDHQPEVDRALAGEYAATARERQYLGPPPGLGSMSRRGTVRVFAALPVRDDGRVVGAVLMSRTSSSPLEAVWTLRYTVLAGVGLCLAATVAVSVFVSRRIVRPVQAITASATAVTRGEPRRSLTPTGFVPAEVASLSAALDRMTEQLTDRAASIAEFAANASHELKTPITAIRGAAELLQESWDSMPAEQRQRFLANIDADAIRMQRLVSRLLELARIQSAPEAAETVPVREFFDDLAARYAGQVRLHLAGDVPASMVIAPPHLEAAVHNLVDNAVRHGQGKPVDVDLGARSDACGCACAIGARASARQTAIASSSASSPPNATAGGRVWDWRWCAR